MNKGEEDKLPGKVGEKRSITQIREDNKYKGAVEEPASAVRKRFWEYMELLKSQEELVLELEANKLKIERYEDAYPELKQAKGIEEKFFKDKFWKVVVDEGKFFQSGKSEKVALEIVTKRIKEQAQIEENRKKQKLEKKDKQEKTGNST